MLVVGADHHANQSMDSKEAVLQSLAFRSCAGTVCGWIKRCIGPTIGTGSASLDRVAFGVSDGTDALLFRGPVGRIDCGNHEMSPWNNQIAIVERQRTIAGENDSNGGGGRCTTIKSRVA